MSSICILTDSAAQFPPYTYPGKNDVRVVPFHIEINGQAYKDGHEPKTLELPANATQALCPRLLAPSIEQFQEVFVNLGMRYHDVIAILTSSALSHAYEHARIAAEHVRGRARVTLIDSQSIAIGLGLLVQNAAEGVARGQSVFEVERQVRSLVPHTYMMLYTPTMSYLYYAGFIDQAQAFVGEMLGVSPIFTLEEGQLSPIEKIRNMRGLLDFMQEFITEFDALQHIALIQSCPPATHEAKLLREHASEFFPQTPFSELHINFPLAMLLGPRAIGLVAVENGVK